MRGVLYLAWRYILWHRWKSAILIAAVTLVVYLPLGLQLVVERTATDITARADATPLLLGRRGSPLELVLNSLYFSSDYPQPLNYGQQQDLRQSGLVDPIPLYVRFHSQRVPIVGTSLDYFEFRGLELAQGRQLVSLGEAVLGARAAEVLGVNVGDTVLSSPESVFELAGVYPLKMPVVGILAPRFDQDDGAIFVDLKTAWIIEGLGHGHQDLTSSQAAGAILKTEGERIVANASLVQYNEITPDNIDSFHFHGDLSRLPLTAILPVPRDNKGRVLIQGRYQSNETLQMLSPREVIDQLLETVFAVQRYVLVAMVMVAVATGAVILLVFLLSWRARRGEQLTLLRLGGSRFVITSLMLAEALVVTLLALFLAAVLTALTITFGGPLLQAVVM
ncbi:MAG: ABC transporter permease [Gammaproteobacteria bacterium]|nr:ABC transporter permease [Gammaproteobacteria bacterium]